MILAHSTWSGHYHVRGPLWGYAHYGQFCEVGWHYLSGACGELAGGGTFVSLCSLDGDYSVILQTKAASEAQTVRFEMSGGLNAGDLCVWRSNEREQFARQDDITPENGAFSLTLEPGAVYSLYHARPAEGRIFDIPAPAPFPFPYSENQCEKSSVHGRERPRYPRARPLQASIVAIG